MSIKVLINTSPTNSVPVNSQQRTTVRIDEVGSGSPVVLASNGRIVVYS
jgi:hypothetical protein